MSSSRVVVAYYNLNTANKSLEATQASLENADATYQAAKTKLDTGLGNKQDMLRALADVKSVEAQLELDYANIEQARAQLAASIGVKVGEYLQIDEPSAPPSFMEIDEGVSTLVALSPCSSVRISCNPTPRRARPSTISPPPRPTCGPSLASRPKALTSA